MIPLIAHKKICRHYMAVARKIALAFKRWEWLDRIVFHCRGIAARGFKSDR
jgi:hypothetical protein